MFSKKIKLVFSVLTLMCCSGQIMGQNYILNGRVEGDLNKLENLEIRSYDGLEKDISINPDGTFKHVLSDNGGIYTFLSSSIYGQKEGTLDVVVRQSDKGKWKPTFSGDGAEDVAFLANSNRHFLFLIEQNKDLLGKKMMTIGEEAFKNKVDSLRESMMVAIEMAEENVTENVKEAVTCDIDAWYVFTLGFYKSGNRMMGKYIAGGPIDMVLRKHTLLVDDIRIKDYKVSEFYRRSASSNLGKNARKHAKLYDIDKRVAFNKVVKNEIENEELRNAMSFSNTKRYMVKVDEDVREDLKNSFLEVSTNEDHIMEVHAIFEDMSGLVEGNPSPAFINYEDANGDTVSLSDLRGKYVYIDFWATWCAPCKKEFPYLKELEEKYKDHDIEFVGISLDKPQSKEKWRKMVAEKELSGIQLFAGKAFDSDFAKAYHVSAIPKFIILDKEGKIVTANAPRPSDEKGIDKIFKTLDL